MRFSRIAIVGGVVCGVMACESPVGSGGSGGGRPAPPDTVVSLKEVGPLVPGEETWVSGRNLSRLTSLAVDGQAVGFEPVSETQVQFIVPKSVEAACDVEGRRVEVVANGTAKVSGRLDLKSTLSLEVGESRVLAAGELDCLRFPAGPEEWVLHVSDFRAERGIAEKVFDLSTRTVAKDASSPVPLPLRPVLSGVGSGFLHPGASVGSHSAAPIRSHVGSAAERIVVEPDLATAEVGDTLMFVDWWNPDAIDATVPDESFLLETVVVAAEGSHVIVVTTDYPDWESFTKGERRRRVQKAAALVDEYAVGAIRSVMQPGFEVNQGAKGRTFTKIDPRLPYEGGAGAGNDLYGQDYHPFTAEIMATTVNGVEDMSAEGLAALIIHELGHSAEALIHYRNGWRGGSRGWYLEAVAELVAETAGRMSTGKGTGAMLRESKVHLDFLSEWPSWRTDLSPWGTDHVSSNGGAYDMAPRLLLYARQKLGQLDFEHPGPTLHQQLMAMGRWDIAAVAEVVGMGVREFLDEAHLAFLTDDRIAGPHSLPQLEAWNTAPLEPGDYEPQVKGGHLLSRTEGVKVRAEVMPGHHQHWYVDGDESRGLSVQIENLTLQDHHQVRLTRLR